MTQSIDRFLDFFAFQELRSKRIEMYDTFAACLKGGRAVHDTLDDLGKFAMEEGDSSKMRALISMSDDVRNSSNLAQGLGRIADVDDKMVLSISATSTDTAALVASVSQMAKMRKLIAGAAFNNSLYYGIVLSVLGTLGYAKAGIELVPQLLRQIPVSKHPTSSLVEVAVAQAMQAVWPVIVLALIALVVFIAWSLSRLTGPVRDVLDKLPIYASYKSMAAGNFLVTLAILYKNKVDTTGALDMIRDNASPYIAYQVRKMFARQQEQVSSDELGMLNTGFVDKNLLSLIRVVARNLSPADAVGQIALGQTEQLLKNVRASSSFASSLLLLAGGIMIAATVVGSIGLLPVLMENLSSSGQR